ncbi:hypothetical protein F5Y16DRAFT_381151 [Xylariaceae sp. FL0255]|nr:hypothetical protein F5Y16DRAFT_381151 [Xylariaceae sp. FL0255]
MYHELPSYQTLLGTISTSNDAFLLGHNILPLLFISPSPCSSTSIILLTAFSEVLPNNPAGGIVRFTLFLLFLVVDNLSLSVCVLLPAYTSSHTSILNRKQDVRLVGDVEQ